MNTYRVECTSYVNRRVSNMAVDIVAPDVVTATRLGVYEVGELMVLRAGGGEITKVECELIGAT